MARRGSWLDRLLYSLGGHRRSRFGRGYGYGHRRGFGGLFGGHQRRGGFGGLGRWMSLLGLGYLGRRYYMNRRAHTAGTHHEGYAGA